MGEEMNAFDKWWMDWHYQNCAATRGSVRGGFTLGQAVVAAWNAGVSFAQAQRIDAVATQAASTEVVEKEVENEGF